MKGLKIQDCLVGLQKLPENSVDLIYLDPPFFTKKVHKLSQRETGREFSFNDLWSSHSEYAEFLHSRCLEMHRVLRPTGSLFFHCDKAANHIVRAVLDDIFGADNFQSEIIWSYKRWSNSKKGLLPSHQTIYFYSKTSDFKFNPCFSDYSEATNIDQILQLRTRNSNGKSAYSRDENGKVKIDGNKKGVPLNDVWEIPYLNPKAKERVGYPTQKPLLLLERIISLVTDRGDLVLDPFFGSGTTLVAAKLAEREYCGFDVSEDAYNLAVERISNPVKTESNLLKKGRGAYVEADKDSLALLSGLDFNVVQRNKGIDVILKQCIEGKPIFIRVQKPQEALHDSIQALSTAIKSKSAALGIVIRRSNDVFFDSEYVPENIRIVDAANYSVSELVAEMQLTIPHSHATARS